MNNTLINDTNSKLNEIIEDIRYKKEDYDNKLLDNQKSIDDELAKVNGYKEEFNEAKKKIQKMTDDINGFETDYNNLVEKFKDDDLANILSGVSKEIDAKIKEKKRNIQRDQDEMNQLVDKAKEAKNKLVQLINEKKALEQVLKQINDVYKYYDEEFERIATYTQENSNNLHPNDVTEEETQEEEINLDELDINEDQEVDINVDDEETQEEETTEEVNETEESKEDSEEIEEEENEEEEEPEESDNAEEVDEALEETTEEEISEEDKTKEIDFNINKIIANDDLEDDDETSIKDFLNKDENNLF